MSVKLTGVLPGVTVGERFDQQKVTRLRDEAD